MKNARGIALMTVAMALFAIGDAFVKVAGLTMTPPQVMVWLMGVAVVFFFALALGRGAAILDPAVLHWSVIGRGLAELVGAVGIVTAFALAPLSVVAAILQANPLVVTMGAALFLGEPVGWRRWAAIGVGFLGVLLIVRPDAGGVDAAALWALLGMFGLSFRDLFTRIVPPGIDSLVLSGWTLAYVVPVAVIWALLTEGAVLPPEPDWIAIVGMVSFGTIAYLALTVSVRIAEISVVAPFRYTRLIFAILIGALAFGERPDLPMLAGSALILGSGLFAMWRDRVARKTLHSPPATG